MSDFQTILTLTGMGISPWSARECTQTLEPIAAQGFLRRSVNGTLVDLSLPQFKKYQSTISCRDGQAPALSGIWIGQQLTVGCISELSYASGGSPERSVVAGSSRSEDGFVFYRPELVMFVTGFRLETDEWGAENGWTLSLEEV